MAHDDARAVPQPVLEPTAQDLALPRPRPPVLERAVPDIARPVLEPSAQDIPRPAPGPVHGLRAGWIVSTVVAAAAAWAVGWVAGVSWAWREMTPGYWSRHHRRRGASLPGAGSPLRS